MTAAVCARTLIASVTVIVAQLTASGALAEPAEDTGLREAAGNLDIVGVQAAIERGDYKAGREFNPPPAYQCSTDCSPCRASSAPPPKVC